jgi:hyperosmotically inducible protein
MGTRCAGEFAISKTMPYPSRRFSPSLDSNASVQVPSGRTSLFDHKEEFIERVAPIGMAAIYFGSFSFAPQDAALSRQALFKLSFAHRYFLQPAGLKIAVQRQTAVLTGTLTGSRLREFADILARQIEGVEEVTDETEASAPEKSADPVRAAAQLLFATDQTLRSGIQLNQEEGQLMLDGEVSSAAQKSWAELLVASVGGNPNSRLKVVPGLLAPATKTPEVDDESLQALILFRLRLVRETEHLPVRVKATRGVVTLQGKVRSEALRQRVENLTRSTLGLRELRSSLTISA